MATTIRPATPDDAERIGTVHVAAWQAAYAGQMPDDYLDALSATERATMWRSALAAQQHGQRIWVVEIDGLVAGFAAFGPERTAESTRRGELYAINLDPGAWGRGAGRALLRAATADLAGEFSEVVLWVLPGNARARRLYESEGWTADGATQDDELLGVVIREIRYHRALLREDAVQKTISAP